MKNKSFTLYWIIALAGVLTTSAYPLYMGVRVVCDMIADGAVMKENYPKYIIPYTPIAAALIVGVLLLPLFEKLLQRFALFGGGALSLGVFFALELLFENKVVVNAEATSAKLEDWQMFMCYVPPELREGIYTQSPVEILMGEYNPAFKLHFYVISIVIVLSVLNCLYGFAGMILSGDRKRLKPLILQSVCSGVFLGLCILACFTAFWRDGSLLVSPLSAFLMALFFILLGVTVGVFAGSFLLSANRTLRCLLPAAISSLMTLLMYIGEMILLHGHLYRFGAGFFFDGIPGIVLAPADLLVIAASGAAAGCLVLLASGKEQSSKADKRREDETAQT